jgi:hypothetical protein
MTETAQAPARPGWWRQILPWAFAAGILAYMFYKVDFRAVAQNLGQDRVSWIRIVAAFLGYCAVYYATDVMSFYRTYIRLSIPMDLAGTARLRFASYAVQAINGAITEIMTVLYLFRVKQTPVLKATSAAGFIYFNEMLTMLALLTWCAFKLPVENRIAYTIPWLHRQLWPVMQSGLVVAWLLVPCWFAFWSSTLPENWPRVRGSEVLSAFAEARLRDYLEVFLYRFSNNLISIGANVIILQGLGIKAPAALLFAVVPIMVNVAYLPVSAGGFGAPQLVADSLLRGYADRDQLLAYSLVWSALFFLTRTLTGLAFFKPIYQAAFPREGGAVEKTA